jgi:segregation and condensation protein B
VNTDERAESLANQAAAWVPPWERPQAVAAAVADAEPTPDDADSDSEVPDELPPLPGEAETEPTVDAPQPVEVPAPLEPDVSGPDAEPDDDEGTPVDAPVPPEPDVAVARVDVPVQGRGRRDTESLGVAAEQRTHDVPELDDDRELRAALEAILLVVDQPVAELQLAQIVEQPVERVASMLDDLSAEYTAAGRGFDLRRVAGGWRLYTRPEYAAYVERFVLDGQSTRLTQAALETLAVIAYKQPVTRSRISAIRGVNCDGVMRTLVTRGLVEECGTEPESGAYLYRTTMVFLEKLGLNTVDQLPALAPFLPDDVEEEFDAQR